MNCEICGSNKIQDTFWPGYLYENTRFDLKKCANCKVMIVYPRPDKVLLDRVYREDAYYENYWIKGSDSLDYLKNKEAAIRNSKHLISILKRFKEEGKLLDVGSAGGYFCLASENAGYDAYGIELNRSMVDFARDELKQKVWLTDLESFSPKHKFDIICLGDTLEHLLDLENTFKKINELISPGGIIAIDVPMIYNKSIFSLFQYVNNFLRGKRYADNPPLHVWEFSPKGLGILLEKNGFRLIFKKIKEDRPKPLFAQKGNRLKNIISYFVKSLSRVVSNTCLAPGLGYRMIIFGRKKSVGLE